MKSHARDFGGPSTLYAEIYDGKEGEIIKVDLSYEHPSNLIRDSFIKAFKELKEDEFLFVSAQLDGEKVAVRLRFPIRICWE